MEVVESSSLEVFKGCVDMMLWTWLSSAGLTGELNDLEGLFQHKGFCNSMILWLYHPGCAKPW